MRAEMNVNPIVVDYRRGRSVTVLGIDRPEVSFMENLDVAQQPARLGIDANGTQRPLLFEGRGEPNEPPANDGRGPAEPFDRSFPGDVFRFAPLERQALLGGMPLPVGAAKLGPIG